MGINLTNNLQQTKQIKSDELNNSSTSKRMSLDTKPDTFEKAAKKDKSNNGKFDISECAKNFAKGILSPLTAIVKHPIMTLGAIAVTVAACTLIPVLGPAMAIGFGGLSVFQLGKGIVNVAKNYKNGEYDKAEKSFNEVGQGTVGVALTALGLKQSAQVAKEAKVMSELGVTSLDKAQKAQIANEIKNTSKLSALKEITSLFTSKTGLKAVAAQFKPSNISARAKDAMKFLFTREKVTKVKKEQMKFTETTEGKRRAAMTTEEIEKEVQTLYKEACDEYGIPEGLRPKIEISNREIKHGGGYSSKKHTIEINENAYRNGVFDLPDVIKHESTHANEAILRQRLPQKDKEKLAVEYLLDKIQNGDKENVITGADMFGIKTSKSPKLTPKMKSDFAQLAKDKLYQNTTYSNEEYLAMVKPLVDGNPEFVKNYANTEEAINALKDYAKGHQLRYTLATNNASGFNTSSVDATLLKPLSEEEKLAAIKSYKNGIDCIESNGAGSGFCGFGGDFNQYQFTPEEVLAQQKGNNFEISKLQKQLETLRKTENFDLGEEARLLEQIKKSELTIQYKTKGEEMYRLYTESINNPQNKQLAEQVKVMQSELNKIKNEIKAIDNLTISGVKANEYSAYETLVHPDMGVTVNLPYNVTNTVNIATGD